MPAEKRRSLNYTELGRVAMGQFGKWAVDISVLGCNLGVCAGYMIFISSNLRVRERRVEGRGGCGGSGGSCDRRVMVCER